jgi:opacity protein-like surface antigen
MKKIIAGIATAITAIALATPAQAAQPADLDDVRLMVSIGTATWYELDYSDQDAICAWYYIEPSVVRKEMARGWYYDVFEGEYSMYDTRRAVYRFLNRVC